jgi:hypothetical protein
MGDGKFARHLKQNNVISKIKSAVTLKVHRRFFVSEIEERLTGLL